MGIICCLTMKNGTRGIALVSLFNPDAGGGGVYCIRTCLFWGVLFLFFSLHYGNLQNWSDNLLETCTTCTGGVASGRYGVWPDFEISGLLTGCHGKHLSANGGCGPSSAALTVLPATPVALSGAK